MLVVFPADLARSQTLRDLIGSVGASRGNTSTPPHPSVARIIVPERGGTSYGSGSLVDIHRDYGIVITNWHVVSDRIGDVSVQFPDGFQSAGKVLKVDKDWDLAAIGIWRPNVQPLRFSNRAPVIGEPLAIAGYGSGQWRLASGRCTQFVSPGASFPADMIEVSVEARQGDSGGPILNQQGEIAGVLFGAGRGATSGSHAPRVNSFLESVYPILREAPDSGLTTNANAIAQEAAKPPVIANANWSSADGNADSPTVRTGALIIEENEAPSSSDYSKAARPLVAAKATPRLATEAELRDWVAPAQREESREPSQSLSQEGAPMRVARINRKQLNESVAGAANNETRKPSTTLVEPKDQDECAKFDPAFPSLVGGSEDEIYSLGASDSMRSESTPADGEKLDGEGLFEQGKGFLALLGGVTILFQLIRFLGAGKAA